MRSRRTYVLFGVLIGLGLSVCFAYISFLYAIHDGFRVAAYLFPYAVLLSRDLSEVSLLSLSVALVLWPLYGAILGSAFGGGRRRLQLVVIILLILHVGIGSLAWSRVNSKPVKVTVENTPRDQVSFMRRATATC